MSGLISVRDVMSKPVKVVRTDTSVQEIVATMLKFDISSVVVVQKDIPVGLVTHKDLLAKVLSPSFSPSIQTARDVMNTPIVTISDEASIEEAAQLMASKKIKKLLAVRQGKLTGIITIVDIVREQPKLLKLLEDLCRPRSQKK